MKGLEIHAHPPLAVVRQTLDAVSLPSSDIKNEMLAHFLAGYEGGRVVGLVGLEPHGASGLLRSLVVQPAGRGAGLGRNLVAEMESRASAAGITCLYLLTNTARGFFLRLGYRDCERSAAPEAIRDSREFSSLCPGDAAFMCKRL